MTSKKVILIVTILFAAVLRLWGLGSIPPHLTPDETALGYNAYSILKTGKDEYGANFPIIFKSFGDWKPGLYVYATVPSIAIFGLNEFATRLPGAISGIIAVWLIYLVVVELFRATGPAARSSQPTSSVRVLSDLAGARWDPLRSRHPSLAILTAFFLAISPWHIHFSRGAWEAGLSLTLTLAGIYFFLRAIRHTPYAIILAALFFGLTLITYQGAKLATTLVVLGLVLLWIKPLVSFPRKILVSGVVVSLLLSIPVITSVMTGRAGRLEVYSVFSYPRPPEVLEGILTQGNEKVGDLSSLVYHSEPLNFARGILGRYLNHYSTRFLFFEGDWSNPRHGVPNAGVILLADIILLIAGIVVLVRMRATSAALFVWYWLLVSPLPAALSRDSIHAIRALNEVIPLTIILALGAVFILERMRWRFVSPLFLIFYFLNFFYFLDQYFAHMPTHNARFWQYGYKQLVEKITPLHNKYKQIVVAQSYDQPYIYFLFYQKYAPQIYQRKAKLVEGPAGPLDVGLVERLDNISFEALDWQRDRGRKGALIVGTPVQIPPEDSNDPSQFKMIDEIKDPSGQTAFRLIKIL